MHNYICENCGKEFQRKNREDRKRSFCSRSCYYEWRKGKRFNQYEPNTTRCFTCLKEFRITPDAQKRATHNFCSKECRVVWLKQTNKGKGHPQYKDKLIVNCVYCGKEHKRYPYEVRNTANLFCSKECFYAWNSENIVGENHPNWQGGITQRGYILSEFTPKLKQEIRKRDEYVCQKCGIHESKLYRKLDTHHIDYDKSNNQNQNLISLCSSCHVKTNVNRDFWQVYFEEFMEKKYSWLYGQNQIAICTK